ncbi:MULTISPECIES: hypothetical protein [unclassified Flavobacterium]|uniref:hypothetical protein n=1 Tax=unclassified Flavobacterium TaxID=196869 RepID=UPI001F098AD2|nr:MULTISPECIES: hypothetical protein [unclassified Flavobacterium]
MIKSILYSFVLLFIFCNCQSKTETALSKENSNQNTSKDTLVYDTSIQTAHIFVALCDNKYQGIVPVPSKIGNGQDPANNLYWGAMYGIKTYFKNSKDWKLVKSSKQNDFVLERLVFKHKTQNFYLIADAYDGKEIKKATSDFLYSSSGQQKDTIQIKGKTIGIKGNAKLLSYIGHDGLMDFQLTDDFKNTDEKQRDIIVLACYSKRFFGPHLEDAKVNPLVWTSNLMAPEAYILHDALSGYLDKESNTSIQTRAATAYSKYQKCSIKAAKNLLVTGW